jgi:hypothetical protein
VIESVTIRKDESYFHADILISEATIENQQIFVCTIRDVTERKHRRNKKATIHYFGTNGRKANA